MTKDTPFEASQEAQEYINKLQTGRANLPDSASPLEKEAYNQLKSLQQRLGALSGKQATTEKQIAQLQAQAEGCRRDIDTVSGQLTAYAQLLVTAEAVRRESAKPPKAKKEPAEESAEAAPASNGKQPPAKKPKQKTKVAEAAN